MLVRRQQRRRRSHYNEHLPTTTIKHRCVYRMKMFNWCKNWVSKSNNSKMNNRSTATIIRRWSLRWNNRLHIYSKKYYDNSIGNCILLYSNMLEHLFRTKVDSLIVPSTSNVVPVQPRRIQPVHSLIDIHCMLLQTNSISQSSSLLASTTISSCSTLPSRSDDCSYVMSFIFQNM